MLTRRHNLVLYCYAGFIACLVGAGVVHHHASQAQAHEGAGRLAASPPGCCELPTTDSLRVWVYPLKDPTVIDADTLRGSLRLTPELSLATALRIWGIDTPESTFRATDNPREVEVGKLVKLVTEQWVADHQPLLGEYVTGDKYGGRIVANVWGAAVGGEPVSLGDWLLEQDLAIEYDGGAKAEWTAAKLKRAEASATRLLRPDPGPE